MLKKEHNSAVLCSAKNKKQWCPLGKDNLSTTSFPSSVHQSIREQGITWEKITDSEGNIQLAC